MVFTQISGIAPPIAWQVIASQGLPAGGLPATIVSRVQAETILSELDDRQTA